VTLAALVKPYAVLALPAFWRPRDWRVPLAIAATLVLCYVPYFGAGHAVLGFLGSGYIAEEGFSSGAGIWLISLIQAAVGNVRGLVMAYVAAAAVIMIALGLRNSFDPTRTPRETISGIALLLTAGLVLISPNYSWYFLALVPFLALGAGAPVWALTLGAFMLYRPIYFENGGDLIWKSLATVPFIITVAFALVRRAGRGAAL
jgi:hypothetical protein